MAKFQWNPENVRGSKYKMSSDFSDNFVFVIEIYELKA